MIPPRVWSKVIDTRGGKFCQSHWMMGESGVREAWWPFNNLTWSVVSILLYSSSGNGSYNLPTIYLDMDPKRKQDVNGMDHHVESKKLEVSSSI